MGSCTGHRVCHIRPTDLPGAWRAEGCLPRARSLGAGKSQAIMTLVLGQDWRAVWTGVIVVLTAVTTVGQVMRWRRPNQSARMTVDNINARIRSWWVMSAVYAGAALCGRAGTVFLFAFVSFVALRELVTLVPTRRADHKTLVLSFFVCLPVQYLLVAAGSYELFSIFVPVICFVCVSALHALTGDSEQFLERTASVCWGLMVCVYCVSHAPALFMLNIPGYTGQDGKLLFFLLI